VILLSTLKKILFWSYDRGAWQYDVVCVLILAFIFLSPNSLFIGQKQDGAAGSLPQYVSREEIGQTQPDQLTQIIARRLSQKEGREVTISSIELVLDDSGQVKGYRVWTNARDLDR
jgi:hypothetical protein